ncbi:adenylate cyclase type 3-like [Chrysoperla carnea]|uniref:adenylate cyclase type 3-like n=1 Tax=Chrysoperla carnea TaxID=189513 RepID=UPI001D067BB2|nr:adenylate cyclase type 3-like [Chrysoperla carnea]
MKMSEKNQIVNNEQTTTTGQPANAVDAEKKWNIFSRSFSDPDLEKLYQSYSVKQKRAGLQCFLYAAILFDLYMLAIPQEQDLITFGIITIFLALNTILLVWCKRGIPKSHFWAAAPHIAWHLANAQLILTLFLKKNEVTGRDSLGWVILLDYLVYVTLPLRLRYCFILSIGTCGSYLVAIIGLIKSDEKFGYQIAVNCVLLIVANILGLTSYFLDERQQRGAFTETRQSLEVKLVIEEQSAEQERLLLSVLPEHVAVRMRQDLGSTASQFKKIYMSRHENVSILYADIVGFTAISSTYSAQDLVKILNELFARFDKLAEKYQQLRIKILGDCYYCISGAPRERPDHAVLCVHMGLSMVKAIKYVQQTTNSPVDMRVGIHTGAVLAGVLGQRQWQFDVYSKDVELANKMESSGKAGRVHISEKTLSFLDGEFEVEPGFGEKREESLRMAGIKTYFIVSVLKPFQPPKKEIQNGGALTDNEDNTKLSIDGLSDFQDDPEDMTSPIEENQILTKTNNQKQDDSENFKKRLRKELVNRDGHKELSKHTNVFSCAFKDANTEKSYKRQTESFTKFSLCGLVVVMFSKDFVLTFILPITNTTLTKAYGSGAIIILFMFVIVLAEAIGKACPSSIVQFSNKINNSIWLKVIAIAIVLCVTTGSFVSVTTRCSMLVVHTNCTARETFLETCPYPSYYSFYSVLILVATSMPTALSYLIKTCLMFLITIGQCFLNITFSGPFLDCEESSNHRDWTYITPGKYSLSVLLLVCTIALAFLARHMEQVSRVLFLWRTEVDEQREKAADMRRRNELLVYNVLPPHVAAHFMGNRKRSHDELYSQSYAEVGVLFASMPNFSDFYSEETVNNQGLECLRFLNEVISDFDALLEQPKFQDIIKIKTIGSTYMAASGLNSSNLVKAKDSITTRWAHLSLLVEFALELKKALQSINEQSFNHFVLKMGVNHGPITAGVIGARKPHYDIWGNTVNVASRMESTGKAGCIQVTQETCEILQNFGYQFEQRGLVAVKGKGQLMTYYLQGKAGQPSEIPATVSRSPSIISSVNKMGEKSPVLGCNTSSTTASVPDPPIIVGAITRCEDIQIKITDDDDNDISSNQPLIQNNFDTTIRGNENSVLYG